MKNEKVLNGILVVLIAVCVACCSCFVGANKVQSFEWVQNAVVQLEDSQDTIMRFSEATLAISLVLVLLPGDAGESQMKVLSYMEVFFIAMLGIIFFEQLLAIEGGYIALRFLIPIAAIFFVLFWFTRNERVKRITVKLIVIAVALIALVPVGINMSDSMCSNYLAYVEETIDEAEFGAEQVNDMVENSSNEDASFLDKISEAFQTAVNGVEEFVDYINSLIKKCMNAVAVLLITVFLAPLFIFILLVWGTAQLVGLTMDTVQGAASKLIEREHRKEDRIDEK